MRMRQGKTLISNYIPLPFKMKAVWRPAQVSQGLRSSCRPQLVAPSTTPLRQALLATAKSYATATESTELDPIRAAPEIDFDDEKKGPPARIIPLSPSYFTAKPRFTDGLLNLQALARKYITLPVVKPGEAPRVPWKTLVEFKNEIGEEIAASKYHKMVEVLHRLNHIHPSLMPEDVKVALNQYKRNINPFLNVAKPIPIDRFGRALGAGRRKTSTARAWVVEGTGEVLINGKPLTDAFGRVHDRESAIWALKATERVDKYNVWALVEGGGTTGQAEAMTLAIAKALLAHEPALKPALRRGKHSFVIIIRSRQLTRLT